MLPEQAPPPAGAPRGDLTGRTLGDFVVGERFGSGGFGEIYRAHQPLLGREAVIKTLRRRANPSADDIQRFLREARIASKLDHPCAAHVYAFGAEEDGVLWIAMELVRGTALNALLEATGPLPLVRLAPLLDRICEVVHSAHEQGIVHRDIKPANVMVISRAGRLWPKLLDFGIARMGAGEEESGARAGASVTPETNTPGSVDVTEVTPDDLVRSESAMLTRQGLLVGTPHYMAPEQWIDARSVGPKTDIYSLGVLAFQTLSGRLPFVGSTARKVAKAHADPNRPTLGPGYPEALSTVLARAMAVNPNDRFATAIEFAAAFRAASGLSDEATPLPQIDDEVRAAALAEAPQPIADAVSILEGARTPHQAVIAIKAVARTTSRYLALCALAARARVGPGLDSQSGRIVELFRALRQSRLEDPQWLELAEDLCSPFRETPDAHPMPELVAFLAPPKGTEQPPAARALKELAAEIDTANAASAQTADIERLLAPLSLVLKGILFLANYPLVVGSGEEVELWMGVGGRPARARRRVSAASIGDNQPALLGADGSLALPLFPVAQAIAPTPGLPLQLFLLEGNGRHGARLVSLPLGLERQEASVWAWLDERLGLKGEIAQAAGRSDRAPFQGLASFGPDDASSFFGREVEAEEFANRLRLQSFLAVVGPSGAGKSSFVQAGVIPLLSSEFRAVVVRPGPSPLRALSTELARLGLLATAEPSVPAIRAALMEQGVAAKPLLLVVDQFEELITLCLDAEERLAYAELLVGLATAAQGMKLVITLRDDFLVRVQQLPPLRRLLTHSIQLLGTPVKGDLIRILTEPLRRVDYAFEDDQLPLQMVDEVADQQGALALLSFTASQLWDLRDRHLRRLSRSAYGSLGGVGGALAHHAEATLSELGAEEQSHVREVFRALITAEGTRAVLSRRELTEILGGKRSAETVLERLIQARLLVASEGARGEDRIEVIHETLLRSWPRLLAWQREDAENVRLRDQLRAAARQWAERGRPSGVLWRDEALAEFKIWRKRFPGALTVTEREFAEASLREETRGRRIRTGVLVAILTGLVVGVLVLIRANQRAEASQKVAVQRLAESHAEQGRALVLAGHPIDALAYLTRAIDEGVWNTAMRYLLPRAAAALDSQLLIIRPGGGAISSVALSPDESLLATSTYEPAIQVWRRETGAPVTVLTGHSGPVQGVTFSPDGRQLLSVSGDGTARLWDVQSGSPAGKLELGARGLWAEFSSDGKTLVTGDEGNVTLWDASTLSTRGRFKSPDWAALAILNRDGSRVLVSPGNWAASTRLREAELIDAQSAALVSRLEHGAPVGPGAFSPDGSRVATASLDGTARIWDAHSGALQLDLTGHEGALQAVSWSADGARLVTGSSDGSAKIWDTATGGLVATLKGHEGGVNNAIFLGDGGRLATTGDDGSIRIWDSSSHEVRMVLRGHDQRVTALRATADGARVITGSLDGTARVWDTQGTLSSAVGEARLACKTTIAGGLFTAGEGNRWTQWDLAQGKPSRTFEVPLKRMAPVWSPTGQRLLTPGPEAPPKEVLLVDAAGGDVKLRVTSQSTIKGLCWSGDEASFGVGHDDGTFVVYEARTGNPIRTLSQSGVSAYCAFSPNGRVLATASTDAVVRLWDIGSGQLQHELRGHRGPVLGLRYSPQGDQILSVSRDETAILWDTATGRILTRLNGHRAMVDSFVFARVHGLVATGASDGMVKIWDASAEGALLDTLVLGAPIRGLAFAPDDQSLFVCSRGSVTRWRVPYEERTAAQAMAALRCRLPLQLNDEGVLVPAAACAKP